MIAPHQNTRTDGRSRNDKTGKEREDKTLDILQKYLFDKIFEPTLTDSIPEQNISLFKCLCDTHPEGAVVVSITKKAGRNHNSDLLMRYTHDGITYNVNLEIKGGTTCAKIEDCPQVLSLAEKDEAFQTPRGGYAAYFYDNYIREVNRSFEEPFEGDFPTRDQYTKLVYGSDYKKHPWFKHAKERTPRGSPPTKIVKQSIEEFLNSRIHDFDIPKIIERVRSTQIGKLFLLQNKRTGVWSHDRFEETDFVIGDTPPTIRIKNKNTLVIVLPNSEISCLLRWKNHIGVLYPAYQIKVSRRR